MCSVQCVVCSMQCAVCRVQCSVCSVQCAGCSVQCTVCSVQCAVCSVFPPHRARLHYRTAFTPEIILQPITALHSAVHWQESAVQCSEVQCSAVQCREYCTELKQYFAVRFSAFQCSEVTCSDVQCREYFAVQCSAVQLSAVHRTTTFSSVKLCAVQCR